MKAVLKKFVKYAIICGIVAALVGGGIYVYRQSRFGTEKRIEARELIKLSDIGVSEDSVNLIAHRGLSAIAPENTLPAIEAAAKSGFKFVEFDVRMSRDNIPVLMHDDTVNRMTDAVGKVSNFTYFELLKQNVDNGANIDKYENVRIATVSEVLDICSQYSMTPIIEIKELDNDGLNALLNLIKGKTLTLQPVIISFDAEILLEVRELMPELTLWYLSSEITEESLAFCRSHKNIGLDFNANNDKNTDENIAKIVKAGDIPLACWTIDSPERLTQLNKIGIAYITTNVIAP